MLDLLFNIAAFVIALGVLITFHEYGHFWVARRLGIKVLRFSVGFGKPIWRRVGGADQTEYVIAAIPLGGYVKMLDEREGEVDASETHRAFNRQSVGRRIAVVVAGPLANFLLAIAAYWLMFMLGISGIVPLVGAVEPGTPAAIAGFKEQDRILAIDGRETETWNSVRITLLDEAISAQEPIEFDVETVAGARVQRYLDLGDRNLLQADGDPLQGLGLGLWWPKIEPVIGGVIDGGAAQRSGLQTADRILRADGVAIDTWQDWVALVRARAEQTFDVEVLRDGQRLSLQLRPDRRGEGESAIGYIGAYDAQSSEVRERMRTVVQFGPVESIGRALRSTWDITSMTLQVLGKLIVGEAALKNLSGPISIAQFAGQSASIGFDHYLNFLALISVSLGVLNLLPIPILDGGHLLYYLIEAARRKPLSEHAQMIGQQVGLALLAALMGLAFYNDIARLIG